MQNKIQKSKLMSRIKSKNTVPEIKIRSILHKLGYRFRLNDPRLPGKPDIVLKRHKKIVFVNGCFWHGHSRCRRATFPRTNQTFWINKITKNKERDKRILTELRKNGWNVLTVWQCRIKDEKNIINRLTIFMKAG